jgi:hypothetical protein
MFLHLDILQILRGIFQPVYAFLLLHCRYEHLAGECNSRTYSCRVFLLEDQEIDTWTSFRLSALALYI